MKLHPWKMYTDSASCYQVFQVVKGYNTGIYNKEEFKSKLKNIDLSNLEDYREHIKVLIKDTLKEEKTEESVIAESVVETEFAIIEEKDVKKIEEEVSTVYTVVPSRKKKYKVEVE